MKRVNKERRDHRPASGRKKLIFAKRRKLNLALFGTFVFLVIVIIFLSKREIAGSATDSYSSGTQVIRGTILDDRFIAKSTSGGRIIEVIEVIELIAMVDGVEKTTFLENVIRTYPCKNTQLYLFGGDDYADLSACGPIYLEIFGGVGDDTLVGGTGDNFINGESGKDYISGSGLIRNFFVGEGENDEIYGDTSCAKCVYKIFGGSGKDILKGGASIDTIFGEDGDDTIAGMLGKDYLWGGTGNDEIFGDSDSFYSTERDGDDEIYGEAGSDIIYGGGGSDKVWGGDENSLGDIILGMSGDDKIWGEGGDDWIVGMAGSDLICGGNGDDKIQGRDGSDLIGGNGGTDTIDAGNNDGDMAEGHTNPVNSQDIVTGCPVAENCNPDYFPWATHICETGPPPGYSPSPSPSPSASSSPSPSPSPSAFSSPSY